MFLQEIVPSNLAILEEECPNYQVIPAGDEAYFVGMMLRVGRVQFQDSSITPFYSSKMGRNMLQVKVSFGLKHKKNIVWFS